MPLTFDLSSLKNVYFAGIGGISMSSLALILKSRGVAVSGYDFKKSETTAMLEAKGISIDYTYDTVDLSGFDTVIYTAAIKEEDPILVRAREMSLLILARAEVLGAITGGYRHSVGVAGTHGKSTTTGMLSEIMLKADNDSTILGGAVIPSLGSTYRVGKGENAVFEACEYKNSYHSMRPTIKVILNVELDHVDFFGNLDNVIASFRQYIDTPGINGENISVVNLDCDNAVKAAQGTSADVKYFSINREADIYAKNIDLSTGFGIFDVYEKGEKYLFTAQLSVPGIHNVSNALAAICSARCCNVSIVAIKDGLLAFTGVKRRFEKIGTHPTGAQIIDDYAHHPDEIIATLKSAKAVAKGKVICVFQPHTYSRTKALLKDFASSLSLADKVILAPIYAARETNTYGISSDDVAHLIDGAVSLGSFEEIREHLLKVAGKDDLILTMGAGDINLLFISAS